MSVTLSQPLDQLARQLTKALSDSESSVRSFGRELRDHLAQLRGRQRELYGERYQLQPHHLKLLKAMDFTLVEGTDVASVAASGKYPFGNSDWVTDIFTIMNWDKPWEAFDGSPSDTDRIRAEELMVQLPMALNEILSRLTAIPEKTDD